ncbi:hypothetical protein D9756_009101 [Leucocoprinus leucothites]|uniref:Uncharacterized protein n=1 Tax=Leucocoprinus leucothites TaxID=201217 RepID=A0A8H5FUD6_9AGAR|nr:hypothetical protein D9756_009101 [Leucoagaricus leucothites]
MPSQRNARSSRKHSAPTPKLPAASSLFGDGQRLRPYTGKHEKLILSIDIGTTFSAASYCILQPRRVPDLEIISSWPGQVVPDSKVPSIVYYNQRGERIAWGAETSDPDVKAVASEQNWVRVEWFKLSLKPAHLPLVSPSSPDNPPMIPTLPLPTFVTTRRVYTDFLAAMLEHIRMEFCKTHSSGSELWQKLYPTMDVVFTIPSGWEMKQQYEICAAAVDAGFMGPVIWGTKEALGADIAVVRATKRELLMNEATQRIRFVSEPEAAIVYAADSGYISSWLQVGQDVILCDAGGGTIDITAYTVVKTRPLALKEKYASKCVVAGAVLVNRCAQKYISDQLRGTAWDRPHILEQLMDEFEIDTKKRFKSPFRSYGIGKGGNHEFIEDANVRDGRLYIPGEDLEKFFKPTLRAIKTELHDIYQSYAYSHLEQWGQIKGLNFAKPDGVLAKAVSQGALLWYLTKPIRGHILKAHYGIEASLMVCDIPQEELADRNVIVELDGSVIVDGGWSTIASMGQDLDPMTEIVADYERYIDRDESNEAYRFEEKIFLCRAQQPPTFLTAKSGHMNPEVEHVCSIVIDLEELFHLTPWETSRKKGKKFKRLEFVVSIMHNGSGLDVYAYWIVKGEKIFGEAKVILPEIS